MGELGFMGMMASPDYSGGGMDTISYVIAMSEIAKNDAQSVIMSVNNFLVCSLRKNMSSSKKKNILSKLAKGDLLGAFFYQSLSLDRMVSNIKDLKRKHQEDIY